MRAEITSEKSPLTSYGEPYTGFDWEWPAVILLTAVAILWLMIVKKRNEKIKAQGEALCRKSLKK